MIFALPPTDAQQAEAARLDANGWLIEHNLRHLHKLKALRSGLAADLLSGRVRTVPV